MNVLGDNQNIKLTGADTNGQYTLIEQNNEPGVGIPPHVHENEDEVFQVLSGQVEMNVGDKTTTLQAGDLIFCPKGVPHSWKVVGEEKARAMLSIFPAGLEGMFRELAELPAGPPDMEKVTAICGKYNLKFVLNKIQLPTMAISNYLFSLTSENPQGFSVWCVVAKLSAKPRNYS